MLKAILDLDLLGLLPTVILRCPICKIHGYGLHRPRFKCYFHYFLFHSRQVKHGNDHSCTLPKIYVFIVCHDYSTDFLQVQDH